MKYVTLNAEAFFASDWRMIKCKAGTAASFSATMRSDTWGRAMPIAPLVRTTPLKFDHLFPFSIIIL
jgi:hypothetical protein